jgi:hypothetical protein
MRKISLTIAIVLIIAGFYVWWQFVDRQANIITKITNFEECAAAGNPVMESYPRQCRYGDQTFVESIGNELEKIDIIRIDYPRPNQVIQSPLTVTGEARGPWFFEASFPVILTNWDGLIIAQGIAQAKSDWMTTDFVPFEARLTFAVDKSAYSNKGSLILKKDNPSGLPQNDDALEIPIVIAGITGAVKPPPIACTQEAKLCPDGSAVGRTGPNCEFAPCSTTYPPTSKCLKDADCHSPQYVCQETQGYGTTCPSTDPTCVPTHTTIAGECKVREGYSCSANSQCATGALCHNSVCTAPIGRQCGGPNDTSCPTDFTCAQGCGPPVTREGDPPPPYYCQLLGYQRMCPICLAKNTLIDTPVGAIAIQQLQTGDAVWTESTSGERVVTSVTMASKTLVPSNHKMIELILSDGRTLLVSSGHPTIDGRTVGDLISGNLYDNARVVTTKRVPYSDEYTYDILPSGETGFYFANGIPLDSTLH